MNILGQLITAAIMICVFLTIGLCDTCVGGAFACVTVMAILVVIARLLGVWQ